MFIAGVLNTILGLFVLKRAKTKLQKSFAYLVFFIAAWVFVNFTYFNIPRYPYVQLSYAVGGYLIAGLFYWVSRFAKVKISRVVNVLVFVLTTGMCIGSLIPNFLLGSIVEVELVKYTVTAGPFFPIYSVAALGVFTLTVVILLRRYFAIQGLERLQMTYVVLGFVVPIVIIGVVDFVLPFFGILALAGLDSLMSLIFAGFVTYAITRNRFLDISIVIRRSLVQLLTFILLFAIYAYALLLVQRGSSSAVSLNSNTSLLITIFIIAITIEPLRKFIYKWIDGMFENKERQRQEALKRLQMVSASTTQFQSLLTRTEDELSKAIGQKPAFLMVDRQRQELVAEDGKTSLGQLGSAVMQKILTGKILIADELTYRIENGETSLQTVQTWFGEHHFAALVPLGSGEECIGLFGFPQRGSAVFTMDIVHFLKSFQDQLQFAFANALAYKQAIERITSLKH